MPITISLTDFIDFMVASGTSRLTKVRTVKCRPAYHPSTDYWKPLRESIVDFHNPLNMLPKDPYFQEFLRTAHPSKAATYKEVVTNYKKFLGRKTITSLPVNKTTWEHRDLQVRANPEIFLNIDGSRELIKLYFKQDPLLVI